MNANYFIPGFSEKIRRKKSPSLFEFHVEGITTYQPGSSLKRSVTAKDNIQDLVRLVNVLLSKNC